MGEVGPLIAGAGDSDQPDDIALGRGVAYAAMPPCVEQYGLG